MEVGVDITSLQSVRTHFQQEMVEPQCSCLKTPSTQLLLPLTLSNNKKTKPKAPAAFRALMWS